MPCFRCGVRQTDPARGQSPWRRGVLRDHLVLICPTCLERADWAASLDRCGRCDGTHLMRRLDQVECLDCGRIREASELPAGQGPDVGRGPDGGRVPDGGRGPDAALADEVSRALDRILGGTRIP